MKKFLVYAIGNIARGDDGLGPIVAEKLGHKETTIVYQPNVEDAELISQYEQVLFVDAAVDVEKEFELVPIAPVPDAPFSTHSLGIPALLAVCEELYQKTPKAFLLSLRGENFELGAPARDISDEILEKVRTVFPIINL